MTLSNTLPGTGIISTLPGTGITPLINTFENSCGNGKNVNKELFLPIEDCLIKNIL